MNVFVTGANGLLGTNLVQLLLKKRYNVKALVRNPEKWQLPKNENLQLIIGALHDDISEHLIDVSCVIHIAAVTDQNLVRYRDYCAINYEGTRRIINHAISQKVSKFIFVSTANTIGFNIDVVGDRGERPMDSVFMKSYYARSKALAETYVLSKKHEIEVHIINPTFMIGGFDTKPSSGRIVQYYLRNRLLFYPSGGKNFVSVQDVATALESSILNGENGRRYLITGKNLSYYQLFKKIEILTGKHHWMIPLPNCLLNFFGVIGNTLRSLSYKTNLSSVNMIALQSKCFYAEYYNDPGLERGVQNIETAIKDFIHHLQTL